MHENYTERRVRISDSENHFHFRQMVERMSRGVGDRCGVSRLESDPRHMVLRFGHAAKEGAGKEKDRRREAHSAKGRADDLG
jgi:hypothetical protein